MSYSLAIPVYNEINYIKDLLANIESFLVKPDKIILVDGGSVDGTFEFLSKESQKNSKIILAHNEKKFVPNALNIAISLNSSSILIRLDAHSIYSDDYTKKILEVFENMPEVDIVGGPMRIHGNINLFQKAIGIVTTYPFVIGPSTFHNVDYSGITETVYLGAYRSEVFHKVGLFDLDLHRNQDDEFHYRAVKLGCKIYQDSRIVSCYVPRNDYKKLFKQYFEYGLYKPLVYKKNNSTIRLRHIIPSIFVIYISCLPILFFLSTAFLLPLYIYICLLFYMLVVTKNYWSFIVIPILHISYGIGFLKGLSAYFNKFV